MTISTGVLALINSAVLNEQDPERTLYLAISRLVFGDIFSEEVGQLLLKTTDLRLIVFHPQKEEIVQWIT